MADFRRIMAVLIITVLFTVFVFSLNEAVNPNPDWDDFCDTNERPVKPYVYNAERNFSCPDISETLQEDKDACKEIHGDIQWETDFDGCPIAWKCEICQYEYEQAQSQFKFWTFLIAAVLGLVAVAIGIWLPASKNPLNEWVGTGFLFGGLMTLFIGTGLYFSDFLSWLRPIVILLELILVIFIAYKKLNIKKKK
ncbi:MAG: hypothetical protein KKG59_03805 [Nanoarchaeota archaeon]|nr:hypothetical protein [Nanoarchaeota archaeon]